MEEVRQLPDGEELVIVRDTSRFRPGPAETDPRASSLHRRQAAVATDAPTRGPDMPPSAPATQGLSAFDRDRAGSLADEGGVSAAAVEARGDELFVDGVRPGRGAQASWRGATLLVAGAFAILTGWRFVRRRGHA
jgi:hypothetical protein